MPTLKKDQYQASAHENGVITIQASAVQMQTFTPSVSGLLNKVYVSPRGVAGSTGTHGDLVVSILDTDLTTVLAQESFAPAVAGNPAVNLEVAFSTPPSLTAGNTYAIRLSSPDSNGSKGYRWLCAKTTASATPDYYANGTGYTNSTPIDTDFAFVTEMSVAVASPGLDMHTFGQYFGGDVDNNTTQYAQTFEPSVSGELSKIQVGLKRSVSQTGGSITVEVQEVNGSNEPNGVVLATEAIPDANITVDEDTDLPSNIDVIFSIPTSVVQGTRYAIVLKFNDASGVGSYFVYNSNSQDPYANGTLFKSTDSGSSWVDQSKDMQLLTFISEPTIQTIDSDSQIEVVQIQTLDSDAFVGQETIKTIDSDADIKSEQSQTIDSDSQIGVSSEQTIDSDSHVKAEQEEVIYADTTVEAESEQTINSSAAVLATIAKQISGGGFVSTPVTKTIQSDAQIIIQSPELKLYASSSPTIEVGTPTNPIVFSGVIAGEEFEHPSNPFYLWNDKGGSLNAVDARQITLSVLSFEIQDELMGVSNGNANQTFTTAFSPVIEDATDHPVVVRVNGAVWTMVDTLATAGSNDTLYTFDYSTGIVTFGDGVNGKIPDAGATIEVTYSPQDTQHGFQVEESSWLGVRSTGVISNPVSVNLERVISLDNTSLQVTKQNITAVSGVFLNTDPNGLGTNYFTGGSFNSVTGVITLGTALPSLNTEVFVNYTYAVVDDIEPDYTQLGPDDTHEFANPIPKNNAKHIYLRLVPPANSSPSGLVNIKFKIKLDFKS